MSTDTAKVLLIEDNPGDARLIREILCEAGDGASDLLTADTLSSGLDVLGTERVDAVLLDLSLPDSYGYDTFERVYTAAPQAAVIILTGLDDETAARDMVRAGAQDYLVKGRVEGQLLWRTIRFAVERKRMEARLQASEQRYGTLANAMPQMVWATDENGSHFYYNQRWYEYTGLSEEESLGFGFTNALHPDDKERTLERWKSAWQDGESYEIEYRFRSRPRGEYRWFLGRAMPVRDARGKITQWVGTCTDIDDQKRAEEALRRSEDRYRDLVENSQDLFCTHDLDGRILSVNRCAAKLLGYDVSALVGKSLRDIIPSEFHDTFGAYLERIRGAGADKGLMTVQTAAGEQRIWEFNNTLRREGVAAPLVRGMARDVTEWVLAEASLRQSEKDYRGLFEQAHDAIIVFDPDGEVVLDVNEQACEMYGFSRAEFVRMSLEKISKDVPRGKSQVEEALRKGHYLNFQTVQYRKDGREITLEINAAVVKYKGRRAILSINRDVTERHRAEKALQDSEQKYRMLIEQASDGIMVSDREGRIEVVNSTVCGELGYTREELIGMKFTDLMPAGDIAATPIRWADLQTGNIVRGERRVQHRDGTLIPVEVSAKLLDDGRLQAFVRDITERKRAEEEIKKREAQLREAQSLAHVGSWEWDPASGATTWSDELYRIWGVDPRESGASYENVLRIIHPADRELLSDLVERAIRERESYVLEHRIVRPDGEVRTLQSRGLVVLDEGGQVVRLIGTSQDITERKRAEEVIREADQRALQEYERLLDRIGSLAQVLGKARDLLTIYRALQGFAAASMPRSGVFVSLYDPRRQLREAAYAWSEGEEVDVSGLPPMPMNESPNSRAVLTGEVIITDDFQAATTGLPVAHVGMERDPRVPQSSLVAPMAVMGRVIGAVEVQSTTLAAFNQSHATAIRMAANLAAVAIENVRLLERERSQEEQLRQAQKMEAVGHLAGGVAHDFNNLVTAITGYSTLALRRLDPADDKEALLRRQIEEIKKAGERAGGLTHQLLAFSRKQILQPKILNLNDTVADISKMLRRLIGEDIDLVLRLDSRLGMVEADPTQIEQIIMNLAVNARDAMPKGGALVIETENVFVNERPGGGLYSAGSGPHVRLTVSDTGTGMDRETLQRVFEPFFTTKGVGKGTGLGLSTVYGIVNQSGGSISVYSEVGHGSTFKIYLPRVDKEMEVQETADAEVVRGSETVLLVEDEASVRELARTILEEFGYTVLKTEGAKEALRVCEEYEGQIHLMLTDVIMPQMGGKELSERVNALRADTRVLYMSGYTDDMIVHHGVLEQGTPFLQKPFTPDALARKLREVLDARD